MGEKKFEGFAVETFDLCMFRFVDWGMERKSLVKMSKLSSIVVPDS